METLYRQTPPWILTLAVFALLIALLFVGAFLRHRKDHAAGDAKNEDDAFENLSASAILGLLALLLGFSFALALDRFDLRRSMTLQEANAISTTYLRSQLMDEPYRTRFHDLLQGYTAHRIKIARVADADVQRRLSVRTEQYRRQMAAVTLEAIRPVYNSEFGTAFMDSVNETLNIGAARKAARLATIPARVLVMLLLYLAVTSVIVGFVMERGRERWAAAVLLLMLAMSYGLILDIDQPNRGSIRESQGPMEDVLQSMQGG
ncbi:MAG: hypothetical protein ACJ8ER_06610 [Allosphingosinicella sp.]